MKRLALLALCTAPIPGCLAGWTPPVRHLVADGTYALPQDGFTYGDETHTSLLLFDYLLLQFANGPEGKTLLGTISSGVHDADAEATEYVSRNPCEDAFPVGEATPTPGGQFDFVAESLDFNSILLGVPSHWMDVDLHADFTRDGAFEWFEIEAEIDLAPVATELGSESICDDYGIRCDACSEIASDECIWLEAEAFQFLSVGDLPLDTSAPLSCP